MEDTSSNAGFIERVSAAGASGVRRFRQVCLIFIFRLTPESFFVFKTTAWQI
jgi:hypothetical protein